jgi:hypothetical protein
MGLSKAFKRKVRAVRIRSALNLLLRQGGWVVLCAAGVTIAAVLVERLLALTILTPVTLGVFAASASLLVVIPWLLKIPTPMQASLLLDERLGLRERFSTTLALAASEDPFAQAARVESSRVIEAADPRKHFPIRPTSTWAYGAALWVIVVALVLFLPQKDLLGLMRRREQRDLNARQLVQTRAEVIQATESVRAAVQQLGDPNLAEDLARLDKIMEAADPLEIKREAIKALGDLSEKVKKMQAAPKAEMADALQQMFKRLKGSTDPFSQQIRGALAKGDYKGTADMLEQLQKQLGEGTLPFEKQQQLARQIEELANELKRLSEQQRQLADELAKLGLDKKLAALSAEQLRQALQKQGLDAQTVEKILQKAAACQAAQGQLAGLGNALSGATGADGVLLGEGLAEAIGRLNAVETLQVQSALLASCRDELSSCAGCLGQGLCQGTSGGLSNQYGIGTETTLSRAPDTHEQTATKTTRAQSKVGQGPVIAGWYFKDMQVKGESRRGFTQVMQAGRAGAAEAISENQIPRKYEPVIKQYFDQLEASSPP